MAVLCMRLTPGTQSLLFPPRAAPTHKGQTRGAAFPHSGPYVLSLAGETARAFRLGSGTRSKAPRQTLP